MLVTLALESLKQRSSRVLWAIQKDIVRGEKGKEEERQRVGRRGEGGRKWKRGRDGKDGLPFDISS